MDREYIQDQITLLLMGEKTEMSEEAIRREMARDPELRKTYEETLTMLETAVDRTPPAVSEERWRKFTLDLHGKLEQKRNWRVLTGVADFFRSPIKLSAAASVAAVLIVGIFVFLHHPERLDKIEDQLVKLAEEPITIKEIEEAYTTAEGLIPSEEELYLIEDIYAGFAQMEPDILLEEMPGFYEYDIEDLRLLNGSNGSEDIS